MNFHSDLTRPLADAFQGRRVWLSGVSGFKGSWLAEWLLMMGAQVRGFSLPPPTKPSLFELLNLADRLDWQEGDLCEIQTVRDSLTSWEPDFVFHLAAQPLVRLSYREPVQTWQTNVMGTIHVLEALRLASHSVTGSSQEPATASEHSLSSSAKPVAVMITTDKCYDNREWLHGYREEDALGGYDPYSSSKAACEVAIASWRRSYFRDSGTKIFSARAGNVIGGGDWADDRIVPDTIRALLQGEPVPVRNRQATRPWQHVLEPLSGYLSLAASAAASRAPVEDCARSAKASAASFNFGPDLNANRTVEQLVVEVLRHWPGKWVDESNPNAPHEAGKLNLTTDKAFHLLGWMPRWDFETTIRKTVEWYRADAEGKDMHKVTCKQIAEFCDTDFR